MMDTPVDNTAALIGVTVVCSPLPRVPFSRSLRLPLGSTVADAVEASGLFDEHPGMRALADAGALQAGVWGVCRALQGVLAAGDRVELYRPLQVDPKEARRLRYRSQGERGRKARVRVVSSPALVADEPA
jgi:uncharacterized protein